MGIDFGRLAFTPQQLIAAERSMCERSLATFVKRAWPILEPATPLVWGWPLDAICIHLEALTRGYIDPPRLLITVPPGFMKSLLVSVLWPAWEWGPMGMTWKRVARTSHTSSLAERDNIKVRTLITSDWFRELWPLNLRKETDEWVENDRTGFQRAMAFTKMTGKRGDTVILDDPISADDANYPARLWAAERAFTETLPSRVNSLEHSAIVVIMQRLHEADVAGIIKSRELQYMHLNLPMEYEREQHCRTPFFNDPRRNEGELLFPERFSAERLAELKKTMGSYAWAGQYQQRPAPRGGGMFKKEWFPIVKAAPARCVWVRGWDLAGTDDDPNAAYTAGVLMGRAADGMIYIKDVRRGQWSPAGVVANIKNTARQDGIAVYGDLPQDPGQAGKAQVGNLIKELIGFNYTFSPESGSKEVRAMPFSAQAEAGNVALVEGPWNNEFLDELAGFPTSKLKDQVDAATRAFAKLLTIKAYPLAEAM